MDTSETAPESTWRKIVLIVRGLIKSRSEDIKLMVRTLNSAVAVVRELRDMEVVRVVSLVESRMIMLFPWRDAASTGSSKFNTIVPVLKSRSGNSRSLGPVSSGTTS